VLHRQTGFQLTKMQSRFKVKMTSFQLYWSKDMSIAFSKKNVLGLAMISALIAASGAACAQSPEYRQGYDQGYRDAMEAQNHHEHDGPAGRIIIEEARYGAHDGGACDARDAIQRNVGWRRHFDVLVGNELCGDPAHGQPKRLHVRYRCGDSQPVHAEAPEGAIVALSCQ
jgi:hypothetical protein